MFPPQNLSVLLTKKLAPLQAKQRQFNKPEGNQKVLELKATDKLDNSSSAGGSRLAKVCTVDCVHWQAEVNAIEKVKEVRANREPHAFAELIERNLLDQVEVKLVEARTNEGAAGNIALPGGELTGARSAGGTHYT